MAIQSLNIRFDSDYSFQSRKAIAEAAGISVELQAALPGWQASDLFDDWRYSKNLYEKIKSFEIKKIKITKGKPLTAIVSVIMDGKPYTMQVIEEKPISWVD